MRQKQRDAYAVSRVNGSLRNPGQLHLSWGDRDPRLLGSVPQVAQTLAGQRNRRKMTKLKQSLAEANLLPRARPERDITYAALYLASDEGSFVNCSDLVVDDNGLVPLPRGPRFDETKTHYVK